MSRVVAVLVLIITITSAETAFAQARYIDTTKVNCRQAASMRSPIVVQFVRNEPVTVVYAGRGWSQIDHAPLCWIRPWLLAREPGLRSATAPLRLRPLSETLRNPDWSRSRP